MRVLSSGIACGIAWGLALGLLAPSEALACSSCSAGDPTLTVLGVEKPFAGRLRLGSFFSHRSSTASGESGHTHVHDGELPATAIDASEQKLQLAAAYAPLDELIVLLRLPLVRRTATAMPTTAGLGDLELTARWIAWQDSPTLASHVVALQPGLALPTGPVRRDAAGEALGFDVQPGRGAVTPSLGLGYSYFAAPFAFFSSATVVWPAWSRHDERLGETLVANAAAQLQPIDWLALQLGSDTRWAQHSWAEGERDHDTGGLVSFATAGLSLSPTTDLLLTAIVRVPVLNHLAGGEEERPEVELGFTHDL